MPASESPDLDVSSHAWGAAANVGIICAGVLAASIGAAGTVFHIIGFLVAAPLALVAGLVTSLYLRRTTEAYSVRVRGTDPSLRTKSGVSIRVRMDDKVRITDYGRLGGVVMLQRGFGLLESSKSVARQVWYLDHQQTRALLMIQNMPIAFPHPGLEWVR